MTASAGVQWWASTLSGYQYSIIHRLETRQCGWSQLVAATSYTQRSAAASQNYVSYLWNDWMLPNWWLLLIFNPETDRDSTLAKVRKAVLHGWPEFMDDKQIKPYFQRKGELSMEDGCLLWDARVLLLSQLQAKMVEEIHEGHPGISRMKSFARSSCLVTLE